MKRREFITLIGGAAAWPLAARAQQEPVRTVAILAGTALNDANNIAWIGAFVLGLEQLGWKEGHNLQIERRGAGGESGRVQGLAREIVQLNPDVIFTTSTPTAAALLRETRIIPVVFTNISDPLGSGLVPSLAHPGANATGFTNFEFGIGGKWLQALKELAPQTRRSALVFNPSAATYSKGYVQSFETAASSAGVKPEISPINTAPEIDAVAKAQAVEPGGSMVVVPDIFIVANRRTIISAAERYRLPTMYPYGVMARDGGLIAYGPNIPDLYRRA